MLECYCGQCEKLSHKLDILLKELEERLYDDCAACRSNVEHFLDKKHDIYFYKIATGQLKECGNSWLRDLLENYKDD